MKTISVSTIPLQAFDRTNDEGEHYNPFLDKPDTNTMSPEQYLAFIEEVDNLIQMMDEDARMSFIKENQLTKET